MAQIMDFKSIGKVKVKAMADIGNQVQGQMTSDSPVYMNFEAEALMQMRADVDKSFLGRQIRGGEKCAASTDGIALCQLVSTGSAAELRCAIAGWIASLGKLSRSSRVQARARKGETRGSEELSEMAAGIGQHRLAALAVTLVGRVFWWHGPSRIAQMEPPFQDLERDAWLTNNYRSFAP